MDSAAPK